MSQKNLGLWIEELDAAIERLQKRVDKIVAGGGFVPSAYVYDTPFMDLSQLPSGDSIRNHTGTYTYTAMKPIAVILTMVVSDSCVIKLREGTAQPVSIVVAPEISYDQIFGPYYLDTGQSLIIDPDSESGTISYADLYVYDVRSSQLQEAPVGLLGRIARTVKKAIKGGD